MNSIDPVNILDSCHLNSFHLKWSAAAINHQRGFYDSVVSIGGQNPKVCNWIPHGNAIIFSLSHVWNKAKKHLSRNVVVNHFKSDHASVSIVMMGILTNWMEFITSMHMECKCCMSDAKRLVSSAMIFLAARFMRHLWAVTD